MYIHIQCIIIYPEILSTSEVFVVAAVIVISIVVADTVGSAVTSCCLSYLSKTALANDLQDFVAVRNVVVWNVDVGSLIIIITAVVGSAHDPRPLLGIWTNKIN